MTLLHNLTGNGLILVCSLAVHLGCALIFVPPRRRLRLLSSLVLLCHGVAACMLLDRRSTPRFFVPLSVIVGFKLVLYGNYHLYLTLRSVPASASLRDKIAWAVGRVIFNPRGQVRRLPPFSRRDAGYVPSKRRFLMGHCVSLAVCLICRKWVMRSANRVLYNHLLIEGDLHEEKESILRRLSEADWREAWIRAWFIVDYHGPDFLTINAWYSFLALIGVGIMGSEPAGWRPIFGSLGEAYTLQRFYNTFWHQLHRTAFTAHSKVFVQSVLRIRNPVVARGCAVLCVSAITSLMHGLAARSLGPNCAGMPQVRWWMMTGVALILEDAFLRLFWWLVGPRLLARHTSAAHAVGYAWVLFYFWWSVPKVQYPEFDCF